MDSGLAIFAVTQSIHEQYVCIAVSKANFKASLTLVTVSALDDVTMMFSTEKENFFPCRGPLDQVRKGVLISTSGKLPKKYSLSCLLEGYLCLSWE